MLFVWLLPLALPRSGQRLPLFAAVLVLSLTGLGVVGALDWVLPGDNPEKPPEKILEHPYPVYSVAFAPDGKTLAGAGGFNERVGEVWLWDLLTDRAPASLERQRKVIAAVAFAPSGQTLATASFGGIAKLCDRWTGCEQERSELPVAFSPSLAFSPDGETLAVGGWERDGHVHLWCRATGKKRTLVAGAGPVAFSPDGRYLASTGPLGAWEIVKLWESATGQERFALRGHQEPVWSVAFSPDGRILASASMDKTVKLWDVGTGAQRATLRGHTDQVKAVAFSPDGRFLASGGHDRTVRLWDLATAREHAVFHGHARSITSIAFAPDGQCIASGSYDRTVRLWPVR